MSGNDVFPEMEAAREKLPMTTWINGKPDDRVSFLDRGFQFGDGIFETLAVSENNPLLWDRHIQRFNHGATRLGLTVPPEGQLREEASQLCRGTQRGVLKIVLTRGVSGRGYATDPAAPPTRAMSLFPWPEYPASCQRTGIKVQFCRTPISRHPILAGLKHLNRLEQILARQELSRDATEGLMLDEQGDIIEGTMTNLFMVSAGSLYTPDLSLSGVAGVMRDMVLEHAHLKKIPYQISSLKPQTILKADEVFLTNSLIGIWPVQMIDQQHFSVGLITKQLQHDLQDAYISH